MRPEGTAGDVDYGLVGNTYSRLRKPDPRIAAVIHAALGEARTVLNVGAGAGAYEPEDREVTAVEPSAAMRAQRPAHLAPAIDAVAEALPFADASFDASMAILSAHQWRDLDAGLAELRRVTRGPVLIVSCDPERLSFWLAEYAPEVIAVEARRYPPLARIGARLGGRVEVRTIPVPRDCTDGWNEAYYARPERLLEAEVRRACSAWSFVDEATTARFEEHLRRDLASGEWDLRHGAFRTQPALEGSLRLVVGRP